ncbi:MAG: helix-turn-helix domain-containing protein [Planctomycetota bacterium]|jgi:hypothetical protein
MAQEYYNLETAADLLGVTPAELSRMRERGEIRAFRDSGDWKFKKDEIDQLAEQRSAQAAESEPVEGASDVLVSEVELGGSDASSSGTVIGSSEQPPEESDVKLTGSDVALDSGGEVDSGDEVDSGEEMVLDAKVDDLEDLDLTIDEDVPLEDSQVDLVNGEPDTGGSAIELGEELDEDDLVLGSTGSGSDITIGQDSGISLVDPQDSGLSLEEEPMELASDEESLALGEDDVLALSGDVDSESPTELKTDDDFLLTPMDEEADGEEETESGSQVIALDDEASGEAAPVFDAGDGMAAMLDEEPGPGLVEATVPDVGAAMPGPGPAQVARPGVAPEGLAPSAAPLPESPYGALAMSLLTGCMIFLVVGGVMAFDLLRNMWSWGEPYSMNSSIMDMILSWF